MTDEDKAWEQFSKAEVNNYNDASAQGMLQAILAELNSVKADTAKLAANSTEAPAPDAGADVPPMPPAEEMPPAPEGMPGETPDMPPMGAGGADVENAAPGAGEAPAPDVGGAPAPAGGPSDNIFEMLLGGAGGGAPPAAPPVEEPLSGAAEEPEVDKTLSALQDALSKATDPEVIVNLAGMIQEYMAGGAQEPAPIEEAAAPMPEIPPEAVVDVLAEALGGGAPAEEMPPLELEPNMGGFEEMLKSMTATPDAPADVDAQTPETEVFQDSDSEKDDCEGAEIVIKIFLGKSMDDVFDANHEKGISDDGLSEDTTSFKACDKIEKSNPVKLGIDDLMNQRLREKSGVDGQRYKVTKSATELRRENFEKVAKSVSSFNSASQMRVGDVLGTLMSLKRSGMPAVEKTYMPLINEIVKYCDNAVSPAFTEPIFRSFGMDLGQIYEPMDTTPFQRKLNFANTGWGLKANMEPKYNPLINAMDGKVIADAEGLSGDYEPRNFNDWLAMLKERSGNTEMADKDLAKEVAAALLSGLKYSSSKVKPETYQKFGEGIIGRKDADTLIDEYNEVAMPLNVADYTSRLIDAGKTYGVNKEILARNGINQYNAYKRKRMPGAVQNLLLAPIINRGAYYDGDKVKNAPEGIDPAQWNAVATALAGSALQDEAGSFTGSPAGQIGSMAKPKDGMARDLFGSLVGQGVYDRDAYRVEPQVALANLVKAYQTLTGDDGDAKTAITGALNKGGISTDLFGGLEPDIDGIIASGEDISTLPPESALKLLAGWQSPDAPTSAEMRKMLNRMIGSQGKGVPTRTFRTKVPGVAEDGSPDPTKDSWSYVDPTLKALVEAGILNIVDDGGYQGFEINEPVARKWITAMTYPEIIAENERGAPKDRAASKQAVLDFMADRNIDVNNPDAELEKIHANTVAAKKANADNRLSKWENIPTAGSGKRSLMGNFMANAKKEKARGNPDYIFSKENPWMEMGVLYRLLEKGDDESIKQAVAMFYPTADSVVGDVPSDEPVESLLPDRDATPEGVPEGFTDPAAEAAAEEAPTEEAPAEEAPAEEKPAEEKPAEEKPESEHVPSVLDKPVFNL